MEYNIYSLLLHFMNYKDIIRQVLSKLPIQIELLRNEYAKIYNKAELQNKIDDLELYEQRMNDGLIFLNNLKDEKIVKLIEIIRTCSQQLTYDNRERYLATLKNHRNKHNISVSKRQVLQLIDALKKINLVHTTKNPDLIKKEGIKSASELWMTPYKSSANAMDIVLGLDKCNFLTQGFHLKNFSNSFVFVVNELLNNQHTTVSSLDLFTFVLIKTRKVAPCSIQTEEWIDSLEDYSKNLFRGSDFWQIKAEYILTFFNSVDEYNIFAQKHFYENFIDKAPDNEFPFLGEIKAFQTIKPEKIISI